jgi:1-pyrroline-5-carboxylate dehydrogenase
LGNWRKEFHHCSSANPKQVATGIVRGAFEFQGQNVQQLQDLTLKVYGQIKEQIITDVKSKMGSPEDFSNFITAVITKAHLIN